MYFSEIYRIQFPGDRRTTRKWEREGRRWAVSHLIYLPRVCVNHVNTTENDDKYLWILSFRVALCSPSLISFVQLASLSQQYYVKKMWHQGLWLEHEDFQVNGKNIQWIFPTCCPHRSWPSLFFISCLPLIWLRIFDIVDRHREGGVNCEFMTGMTSIWWVFTWNLHFIFVLRLVFSHALLLNFTIIIFIKCFASQKTFSGEKSNVTSYHQSNKREISFHVKNVRS